MKPGYYSPHFTQAEMRASQTAARRGIPNIPPPDAEENLGRLCQDILEPIRARFGAIRISSGYRCPEVNEAVGGTKDSAHMDGRAGDLHPLDPAIALYEVVEYLLGSKLAFDQALLEFGAWVHVGIAKRGHIPRRMAGIIDAGGFRPYDSTEARQQKET